MTDIWTSFVLKQGSLELVCLPGIGGRLWDIRFQGQSLLFQNPDLLNATPDLKSPETLPSRSRFGFPLWGGEKTWIAPETAWGAQGPFPTLDSGAYQVTDTSEQHIEMQSKICPDTGLTITRDIKLISANAWTIEHRLTNHGPSPRKTGIWSVMMLNHPVTIGLSKANTPLTKIFGDGAEHLSNQGEFAVFRCHNALEYKYGLENVQGRVFLRCGSSQTPLWLTVNTPAFDPKSSYAHGHDFEVFNSNDYAYCEAEWHSPEQTLHPNETMCFHQSFTLNTEETQLFSHDTLLTELEIFACMS